MPDPKQNLERVRDNVRTMLDKGASDFELDSYLKEEGYTPERFTSAMGNYQATGGRVYERGPLSMAAQGLSFNFADELEAGVRAIGAEPGAYDKELRAIRAANDEYRRANPGTALGAELAGGLPYALIPPLGAARTAQAATAAGRAAPTLMRQTVNAAKTGAAFGAASGAGAATGDLKSRLWGAVGGAAVGGAIGAAIPSGTALLSATARKALEAAGVRNPAQIDRVAAEKILQAMRRDGMTPDQIEQTLAALAAQGVKPEIIADIGGANVKGLLRAAQATPGESKQAAQDFLHGRAMGARDRIANDITDATRMPEQDVYKLGEQIMGRRRGAANALYDAAYASKTAIDDPRILKILQSPQIRSAWEDAQALHKAHADEAWAVRDEVLPDLVPIIEKINGEWQMTGKFPDVRTLDWIKRGLDKRIRGLYADGNGAEAGIYRNMRDELLNRLDQVSPEYAAARAQYRGDSEMTDALEAGLKALQRDPRQIRLELEKMNDAEREMYRTGALDAVRVRLRGRGDGTNFADTVLAKDEQMRQRLREVFPDDASYNEFMQQLAREGEMARTRSMVLGGSPSARIEAEKADMAALSPSDLIALGRGDIGGAAAGAIGRLWNSATGMNTGVQDAISRSLANPNRGAQQQFLDSLNSIDGMILREQLMRDARRRGYATQGGMLPGLLTPEQ